MSIQYMLRQQVPSRKLRYDKQNKRKEVFRVKRGDGKEDILRCIGL